MKDTQSRTASDTRRVFLDTDSLSERDRGLMQRFPQAEKFAITGVEPGPEDSWDACCANYATVLHEGGRFRIRCGRRSCSEIGRWPIFRPTSRSSSVSRSTVARSLAMNSARVRADET